MRHRIFAVLLVVATGASAQSTGEVRSQKGFEMGLTYREGDPFLFCEPWTGGQGWENAPEQCWVPLNPITGTITMMAWCDPPNPYGKSWSNDDYKSLAQYQTICPEAVSQGTYDSENSSYYDSQPIDR